MSTCRYPLLSLMMKDMEKAPELYRPTQFWKQAVQSILAEIEVYGVETFRSTQNFFVPTYGALPASSVPEVSAELFDRLAGHGGSDVRWRLALGQFLSGETQAFHDYRVYLASLSERQPHVDRASESEVGEPAEQFCFDGRRFSRSFLNYLLGINYLKMNCDLSGVKTVMEIGGGFGTLGEILLGDPRNPHFYIDVDIPPTSFVATYYLQQALGSDRVGGYGDLRGKDSLEIAQLQEQYRAVVLCPWQLPELTGSIDLFVNFISFQEMEPDVVRNYLEHVDRLGPRYILLRNIHEGKQKAEDRGGVGVLEPIKGSDYDSFLPNYRLVAANTVPFGNKTVDGFHSNLRIYERRS